MKEREKESRKSTKIERRYRQREKGAREREKE